MNNYNANAPMPNDPANESPNFVRGERLDWMDEEFLRREEELTRMERDLEEKRSQPSDWWNETRTRIREQAAEVRTRFDKVRQNGPDAWTEMKEGIGSALDDLSRGYRSAVRELQEEPRR